MKDKDKIAIALFIIGVLVLVTGVVIIFSTLPDSTPTEYIELPGEITYKEIGHNLMGETIYITYHPNGNITYVGKAQFNTLQVPQKLAEGLYRLPDGSYIK